MYGTPTLYIFPHAGGSANFYVDFSQAFSSDVKRIAVQYPGRRGQQDLTSFTSIPDLADGVYQILSPLNQSDGKVAFFGHSMGALLAFEVARRFESVGNPIAALFVSACATPGRAGYDYIQGSDRGLMTALAQVTGAKREFLENEEFAARILPTLRGLKAMADYTCPPEATVSCPIYAFLGDEDGVVTYENVEPWSERTTSEFAIRMFPGHHFYLNENLPELVKDLESRIADRCVSQ